MIACKIVAHLQSRLKKMIRPSFYGRPTYNTPSDYKSVTLGRITKTKLSKYAGLSQFKLDLEKKSLQKGH